MIGRFCHDIGGYCRAEWRRVRQLRRRRREVEGELEGGCEKVRFVLVVFWVFLGEKKKKMTSIPYLPTTPLG